MTLGVPFVMSILVACNGGSNKITNTEQSLNKTKHLNTTNVNGSADFANEVNNSRLANGCTGDGCQPGIYFVQGADGSNTLKTINKSLLAQQQNTAQWTNKHYAVLVAPGTYNLAAGWSPADTTPPTFELGYYTQVAGVGLDNSQTNLFPGVEVHNQCGLNQGDPVPMWGQMPPQGNEPGQIGMCTKVGGLNNFWRGVENLTMDPSLLPQSSNPSYGPSLLLAVSQASPLRNLHVLGTDKNLLLCDWHGSNYSCGYTSGGFMANSKVDGSFIPGAQQQWITRNSDLARSEMAIWNSVFVGNNVSEWIWKPQDASQKTNPYLPSNSNASWINPDVVGPIQNYPLTLQSTMPTVIREKPFVTCTDTCNDDNPIWKIALPQLREVGSKGSLSNFNDANLIDIDNNVFYLSAKTSGVTVSSDDIITVNAEVIANINQALSNGNSLLIAPGVYHLDGGTINVSQNGSVVLGLGMPSLVCTNGPCLNVTAQQDVDVAGITFDAGYTMTPALLQIGQANQDDFSNPNKPVVLHDVFVRVAETQYSTRQTPDRQTFAGIIIYTNNVIGDNLWIWRADHDKASYVNEVANNNLVQWDQDIGYYGLIVNGNNVSIYGLAVEHWRDYQTLWNGNNGKVYFYQSELPYTIPTSGTSAWQCHSSPDPQNLSLGSADSKNVCASYMVNSTVNSHFATGLGIYSYFANNPVKAPSAIIAPTNSSQVVLEHMVTNWLDGNLASGITNILASNTSKDQCFGYSTLPASGVNVPLPTLGHFDTTIPSQACLN
jgi:hypothetical protein